MTPQKATRHQHWMTGDNTGQEDTEPLNNKKNPRQRDMAAQIRIKERMDKKHLLRFGIVGYSV